MDFRLFILDFNLLLHLHLLHESTPF